MSWDVDIGEIINVLWRRKLTIILVVAMALLSCAWLTSRTVPSSRAEATIALGEFDDSLLNSVPVAKEYFKSDVVINEVSENLNKSKSWVRNTISVKEIGTDDLLSISVTTDNPVLAKSVLNAAINSFKKISDARLYEKLEIYNLQIEEVNLRTEEINGQSQILSKSLEKTPDDPVLIMSLNNILQERSRLLEVKAKAEENLFLLREMKIVKAPQVFTASQGQLWKLNGIAAVVIGLGIGVFLALWMEYRSKQKTRSEL